jgi:DNA transposition AAA+ family ATPase
MSSDENKAQMADDQEEQKRISIPGDTVLTAMNRLVMAGELDEDGKAAVLWFFGHARDKGMSLADAGRCIDRDATTVHRLLNGRYGAAYTNLVAEIVRYRKLADERAKRKAIGFIETSTWRKISVVCRSALYDGMPAYIYGASQIGKTECLLEYARRNNHGQTRYVRMPGVPTYYKLLNLIAETCFISTRNTPDDIARRIFRSIDDRTLLVFDEFHEVFACCGEPLARKIVEFIREIYDRTHCGIVICGTKVVRDEFEKGKQAMVWDQFKRRGMVELTLPDTAPKMDVIKIASAFGLPEPDTAMMDIIREMLQQSGIGKYFKFLQLAHRLATEQKVALAWSHFAQAYKNIKALNQG